MKRSNNSYDTTLFLCIEWIEWIYDRVINAATLTTFIGTAAVINTSLYVLSGITGLGNEAVILVRHIWSSSQLNTLDGHTTGVINAASITTLSGSTISCTAYASSGISGLVRQ